MLLYSSGVHPFLKLIDGTFLRKLVNFYHTTRRHIVKDITLHRTRNPKRNLVFMIPQKFISLLTQMSPLHTPVTCLTNINFNIIIPSTPTPSKSLPICLLSKKLLS
jgi:hypothetical protein